MQEFDRYSDLPDDARGCVVVIGNFDGVHKGHQALIAQARKIADVKGLRLGVLTFEPHPRTLFRPDEPPCRITPKPLKAQRMRSCGVDVLFNVPFDWDFASRSADDFVQDVLKSGLGAAHIVVGYDFKFGQLRAGTPQTIRDAGIEVSVIDEVRIAPEEDLSSSRIRQFLRRGQIAEANHLLGWEWEMSGAVFRGDQRGRELGFPTANVALGEVIHPAYGIYAVFVQIEGEDEWRMGATNIGIRPMFTVPTAQVETYIFDFNGDLYDKVLRIKPVKRLRSEAKFASLEALIAQMEKDCADARAVLCAAAG